MKQSVDNYEFTRAFESIRPENFSRPALLELFDYLEDLERDIGEEMELDVIALCCDWAEYTREEIETEYPDYYREDEEEMIDALNYATHVIVVEHLNAANTYLLLAF